MIERDVENDFFILKLFKRDFVFNKRKEPNGGKKQEERLK